METFITLFIDSMFRHISSNPFLIISLILIIFICFSYLYSCLYKINNTWSRRMYRFLLTVYDGDKKKINQLIKIEMQETPCQTEDEAMQIICLKNGFYFEEY